MTRPVAAESSLSARVRVSLMDLGTVPYDGLVLPLVSPDGQFIAVEHGEAPTWPTLLAAPGAEVPHATQLLAFSLPDPNAQGQPGPPTTPPTARPIQWPKPMSGLLLGRSCDASGFLVEAPQPDGSRWIGHVGWVSGSLSWLVQGTSVNAYAVLGPSGELAYSRRDVDSNAIHLVVRPTASDSREFVASSSDGAYLWPLFSDEPGIVYAFSLVAGNVELHALRIPQKGDPPVLVVVARQSLVRGSDAATVYQMTAALQVPLPAILTSFAPMDADRQDRRGFDKLIIFHGGQGRMCVYDRRIAAMVPLFPGSFGAAPVMGSERPGAPAPGYLITTHRGLEYVPWSQKSEFDTLRGVPAAQDEGLTVVKSAYLPRLTSQSDWPLVLMGPAAGAAGAKIHLFRLRLDGIDGGSLQSREQR